MIFSDEEIMISFFKLFFHRTILQTKPVNFNLLVRVEKFGKHQDLLFTFCKVQPNIRELCHSFTLLNSPRAHSQHVIYIKNDAFPYNFLVWFCCKFFHSS